jgi:hypothetical protein
MPDDTGYHAPPERSECRPANAGTRGFPQAPIRCHPGVPIKVRPNVGAPHAASPTDEPRLNVGQPDIIRPRVGADRYVVTALVVGAIDQEPANAGGAHFAERDLLRAGIGGHVALKRGRSGTAIGLLGPPLYPEPIRRRALLFVFRRFVTKPGSSVRARSPIGSGSAFPDELLLRF